ncbi:hypothetical protein [Xanthomonas vesicatoria]|uniref:Uncharacterized protein n=3 Tax=Xanthomonas vesicatoria TaxID=56460 RepID=A0ABS8LFP0_9XANT|nr:hypothetical protein [Xanthomonas vesicatoria]MCC8624583.1 hypothetical protein [Xanthomonas vesicatoria]MCC8693459.1 hypothetical protein [Xanthomonas vesicatoria]MCC8703725.1 hypothetical protein [Xanthomonas vesicatoria]MDG4489854.1 zinc-dependent metalloprotease [Xanthomonas vesicatoria]
MRILDEQELDAIFGGDGVYAPTLPTVNVTAPTYQSIGGYFGYSYSAAYSEGGGGQSHGSWTGPSYVALPASQLPSIAKVRCQTSAAAVPGHGPNDLPGYQIDLYNAHAYSYPGTTAYYVTSGTYQPPGTVQLRGQTYANPATWVQATGAYTGGGLKLYADAVVATSGNTYSHSYYDEANNLVSQGKSLGALTAEENAVMVTAHEAQHAYQFVHPEWMGSHGRDNIEADAEAFAISALERFRAGVRGNC